MSDRESVEMTTEIGMFMVHNVIDFVCTKEGSEAFAKFIESRTPDNGPADPNTVRDNAEQVHSWWLLISQGVLRGMLN